MSNKLTITLFNNPEAVFCPKQTIYGTIELKVVDAIKKSRGLRFTVEGIAEVKWMENYLKSSLTYHGEKKCLDYCVYLFGSKNGDNKEIPVGTHVYDFTYQLPDQVPYSVEGKHGFIRYEIEANLDIPWGFDLFCSKEFKVVGCDDLNYSPMLMMPYEHEEIKTFGMLCYKSDPFLMRVYLPRTGFGLGDRIPVQIEIINKTKKDVSYTKVQLIRIDTFTSELPLKKTRVVRDFIAEVNGDEVRAGESVTETEFISIPKEIVTSCQRCSIFEIAYELKISARTDSFAKFPEIHIPIIIGSVSTER